MDEFLTWEEKEYLLDSFCSEISSLFPIEAIYIFGSRRFKTGSLRSDIDIFLETEAVLKPSQLRDFIDANCKALDLFVLSRGLATSAVNESFIKGESSDDIITQCRAVKLWSSRDGLLEGYAEHSKQTFASHIAFEKTVLPNVKIKMSLDGLKRRLEADGLPIDPILGENETEVAERLIKVAESLPTYKIADFPGKGAARESFILHPKSEYDFQDLFWLSVKPWISTIIRREGPETTFDGQKKISDFSIGYSRFIIEMKLAKDKDDKREIVKTLDGLARFYSDNANVRFLLFIVYASRKADIDQRDWEARFSSTASQPRVTLKVIYID
ncbi:hypothetical protein ACFYE9_08085 [Rhizobium leguminosarum]|uniref:Polymerase beta nucleotidyltransferase domain-containing protein n=2 Tax=Rhizobium leguminosarum TaxID=384 RepID=A0A154IL58_RHILE|nr:hypothetical protein [Rhizobium leguminosarum]KZB01263.1 hypothetical protein A4A59_13570 [Rhizobium leguminosarum]